VTTTDSQHSLPVAANLLAQSFTLHRPDEVWTADITYVATEEGWLYVAVLKDLFAEEIVGRSFGERMTTALVVRALDQAVASRRPSPELIHQTGSRVAVLQPRVSSVAAKLWAARLNEPPR
jgi:transposase InsO family protein